MEFSINKVIDFPPPSSQAGSHWSVPRKPLTDSAQHQQAPCRGRSVNNNSEKGNVIRLNSRFCLSQDFRWIWFTSLLVWLISLVALFQGKKRNFGDITRDLKLPTLTGNKQVLSTTMTNALEEAEDGCPFIRWLKCYFRFKYSITSKKKWISAYLSPLWDYFIWIFHRNPCPRVSLSLIHLIMCRWGS